MRVVIVPCLKDNYAYLLVREGSREAVVVDPSEAAPVEAALKREGLDLVGILNTHHHLDHTGGNAGLVAARKGIPVYAHPVDAEKVPTVTNRVEDGATFSVAGLDVRTLHIPGHTLGAVAYLVEGAVFTGDTLFVAGCGRMFEGTPPVFRASLDKLAALPGETKVYCGHEYTVSNLRFAETVEPANEDVQHAAREAQATRDNAEPTVPSTIARELATNPFLRIREPNVAATYGKGDPDSTFAAVRSAKDNFR